MSEDKSPLSTNQPTPDEVVMPPEIAAILENTNLWAIDAVEFKSRETNLVRYFSRELLGIMGKVDPEKLSGTVISLQEIRKQEAAKESFKKAA